MTTATLSNSPLAALPAAVPPPWPGRLIGDLYVRHAPPLREAAQPALMVHGLGGSAANWTDLMGLLRHRLDAEAVDLPGFGASPPPPTGGYRLRDHVAAVERHLEGRAAGPVHLFGNSLGGAVCILLAAGRPDLVRTLTLVSPAVPALGSPTASAVAVGLLLVPGLGRRMQRRTPEQRAADLVRVCFANPDRISPERRAQAVAEATERANQPWAADALMGSLRGLVSAHSLGGRAFWTAAAAVNAPTLVVWGAKDRLVSARLAARTAAAITNSRLLLLADVGHVAQIEDPESVARAVQSLLDED